MSSSAAVTFGDTQPKLSITLYTDSSLATVRDLSNATSVSWVFSPYAGGTDVTKTAVVASPATGGVTTWQWDGTIPVGVYLVHPVIDWNDGSVETTVGPVMTLTVNPAA